MSFITKEQYLIELKQDVRECSLDYSKRIIKIHPSDLFNYKINLSEKYKEYQFKFYLAGDMINALNRKRISPSDFNEWSTWFFNECKSDNTIKSKPLCDVLSSMGSISYMIITNIIMHWGAKNK